MSLVSLLTVEGFEIGDLAPPVLPGHQASAAQRLSTSEDPNLPLLLFLPPAVRLQASIDSTDKLSLRFIHSLHFSSMSEKNKPTISLQWAPKLPPLSCGNKKATEKLRCEPEIFVLKNEGELVDGLFVPPRDPRKLNKLLKKQVKDTTGRSWFDMPAPTITPELKKDLQILKLRSAIDPKRHYKKGDSKALPKYFQVGTVIESASDFFSGRLTKKERKASLAEELLSDQNLGEYRKRKVREIEAQHNSVGVQKWKNNKGGHNRKRAKQRRS